MRMGRSWDLESLSGHLHIDNALIREWLAEFIATFLFVLIGTSANVQQAMSGGPVISTQIAWGIAFAFALFLANDATGGHLNPAISFTFWLLDGLSLIRLILYSAAQFIGAFCGAAIAFCAHLDDIRALTANFNYTTYVEGLFFTEPSKHMSTWGSFFDQVIGTAILSSMICLISDVQRKIPKVVQPFLAGLVMTLIAMSFGANCGFAINPARDLGPRIFLLLIDGWIAFWNHNYYFWIPIIGPLVGAPLGAILFKLFIGLHEDKRFGITGISYTYPNIPSVKSLESLPAPILPHLQQKQQQQQQQPVPERDAVLTILVD